MRRRSMPIGFALVLLAGWPMGVARADGNDDLRFDVGVVGASAALTDRNSAGMVAEIKVKRGPHLEVGGKVEIAVMFGGTVGGETLPFGLAAAALAQGEYQLGTAALRPLVGVGAGVYSMGSHTIVATDTQSGISTTSGRYLGVAPTIGVMLGRVRLTATYHAILGTSVEYRQTSGGVEHRDSFSPSYLSLALAVRLGGP